MITTFKYLVYVAGVALLLAAVQGCTPLYSKDDPESVHYYCVMTQVWHDSGYKYGLSESSFTGIICSRPYVEVRYESPTR